MLGNIGFTERISALQNQRLWAQAGRLINEPSREFSSFPVQPQVPATNDPARSGFNSPGTSTGDGVVYGEAALIEARVAKCQQRV